MTIQSHKKGLSVNATGMVDVEIPVTDVVEILSTAKHQKNGSYTKSGHRVDKLSKVETLALNMLDDSETRSLAIDYSVLQDPEAVKRLHPIRPIYYLIWPFAMLEAFRVFLKITIFRLMNWKMKNSKKLEDQVLFLLGPQRSMSLPFDWLSPILFAIRHGVATSVTLDLVYNYHKYKHEIENSIKRAIVSFWLDLPESIGVRNRLKMVYTRLVESMEGQYATGKRSIKVLSLACGSAQATIEAIATVKAAHPDLEILAELVDLSEPSLKRAAVLAKARGVEDSVRTIRGNIKEYLTQQPSDSWDLMEMVGFLDYRKNNSVIDISRQVRRVMKHDAVFITATICPSFWAFILRWLVNWPFLLRRNKEQFQRLLFRAGFASTEDTYEYEPTKCFLVATCHK